MLFLFLGVPFKANADTAHDKIDHVNGLCEIYWADKNNALYPEFYDILEKNVSAGCIVLIHPTEDDETEGDSTASFANGHGGCFGTLKHGNNGSDSTVQETVGKRYPLIVVNGKKKFLASPLTDWQADLAAFLEQDRAAQKWKLELYLSSKRSRDDKAIVDFSICNMEKTNPFSGRFILWIAEMKPMGNVFERSQKPQLDGDVHASLCPPGHGGLLENSLEPNRKGWVAVKKLVEKKIKTLPPAKSIGCSLPDQFSLPQLSKEKKYGIISVVYASDLSVQAVGLEFIAK